ncbi:response regulator [Janthinobacterium sp. GW460P]|uniref:hypothetical protein n=1 Tax=unclassified Janthinobacterium TaxID=2610881 RepID=UPI000A32233D|nr:MULTISPECIES: hypothetical protein [unclassified Janthinobacterium]MCC7701651.1 response regulator [Janthinobacterium sp. GW460P]MCC7707158.1 response regulator [Janthinobacterium sp. GW460W]
MFTWLQTNVEWIFSGFGVAIAITLWGFVKKPRQEKIEPSPITINNTISNNVTPEKNNEKKIGQPENLENENPFKKNTRILFIDDDIKFQVVSILKTAGWKNTKILKDIPALDCFDVNDSNILFIDIQGVGKALGFSDEGLGLALAIKKKYPMKKVIIYSAQTTGERFHQALRTVDYSLPKNSEPYEFIRLIEEYSCEIG